MTSSQPTVSQRHTIIGPLQMRDQIRLACDLAWFFGFDANEKLHADLGHPKENVIRPLSVGDFFTWARKTQGKEHYSRLRSHVELITKRMETEGFLSYEGKNRSGALLESNCYYFAAVMSKNSARGLLWLGKVLGPAFIAHELQRLMVRIVGTTTLGDQAVGTGLHVHPQYVITCDHVLRDMKVGENVIVNGQTIPIADVLLQAQPKIDVGVIKLATPVEVSHPDIAFRDAQLLESVVVAGYPTVPTAISEHATFHSGEICQVGGQSYHGFEFDLFSAIARPGNSGGPVISREGNVVGIVTQSLERETEEADKIGVMPFFVSVPARDIRKQFKELTQSELPWESYE